MLLFAFNLAKQTALHRHDNCYFSANRAKLSTERNPLKTRCTFVVNEDITIKPVPKQQDVFWVFEIDVRSGEEMGVETVERDREAKQHFE